MDPLPDAVAETGVDEEQWRSKVSTRLAGLQAELAALRTEDQRQRQESGLVWMLAIGVLVGSVVLVFVGIGWGLAAPAQTAAANKIQAQIASINNQDNNQLNRAFHTKAAQAAVAKCNQLTGDDARFNCVVKADPVVANSIANTFGNSFGTLLNDEAEVQGDNLYAHELEVAGPAALACASAIFGAVLGWMLQQWFARISRRRAGGPENSAWNEL